MSHQKTVKLFFIHHHYGTRPTEIVAEDFTETPKTYVKHEQAGRSRYQRQYRVLKSEIGEKAFLSAEAAALENVERARRARENAAERLTGAEEALVKANALLRAHGVTPYRNAQD